MADDRRRLAGYFFRNPFLTPKSVRLTLSLFFDKSGGRFTERKVAMVIHPIRDLDGKFEWRHGLIAWRNHAPFPAKNSHVMNSEKEGEANSSKGMSDERRGCGWSKSKKDLLGMVNQSRRCHKRCYHHRRLLTGTKK